MVQPSRKRPYFDFCCSTAQTWRVLIAHGVVFSINADRVGFVVGSVALVQVSFALLVSFRRGIRTVEGNNKRQQRLNIYQI